MISSIIFIIWMTRSAYVAAHGYRDLPVDFTLKILLIRGWFNKVKDFIAYKFFPSFLVTCKCSFRDVIRVN